MALRIWPYVKYNGQYSIPDMILQVIWQKMVAKGRHKLVFYDGHIRDADAFIDYLKQPSNTPVLVVDDEEMTAILIAWANNYADGVAYAHFCYIGDYEERAAKMVLDHWASIETMDGEPVFRMIVGLTPKSGYEKVLKIIEDWGFIKVGEIPEICNLAYQGRRDAGVISYRILRGD